MVNDPIEYAESWSFKSKNVAENFDQHVTQSVPLYNEIQRMVTEMSTYFIRDGDVVLDIGASTGTTTRSIDINNDRKHIQYIAIDESQEMVDVCNRNLNEFISKFNNTEVICADLNQGMPSIKTSGEYSFVISLFTLQFLKKEKRLNVLRDICRNIRDGGAIVFVEKVLANDAHFNEMMIDLYHDMKLRNGLTAENNQKKSKSLRGVMTPIALEENRRLLVSAGFNRVDLFFKWYNFAGFIATK